MGGEGTVPLHDPGNVDGTVCLAVADTDAMIDCCDAFEHQSVQVIIADKSTSRTRR